MKLLSIKEFSTGNELVLVSCECGSAVLLDSRDPVVCKSCKREASMQSLRDEYEERQLKLALQPVAAKL